MHTPRVAVQYKFVEKCLQTLLSFLKIQYQRFSILLIWLRKRHGFCFSWQILKEPSLITHYVGLGKRHWSSAHPRYCDANRTTHSSSGTKSISTSSLEDITYKLTHTHNPSTMHTHTLLRLDLCPCCS